MQPNSQNTKQQKHSKTFFSIIQISDDDISNESHDSNICGLIKQDDVTVQNPSIVDIIDLRALEEFNVI